MPMKEKMKSTKQKLEQKAINLWKTACFEKYGNKCELDDETFATTPHHFYYRSSYPMLKYEVSNGVILCRHHHAKLHFKDPKSVENLIIAKRGKKWFNKLTKLSQQKIIPSYKTDAYLEDIIRKLQ